MPDVPATIPDKIPARYVGAQSVLLSAFQGPFRDGDGKPLDSLLITRGATLMLGAREVLGASYKFDVTGQTDPLDLGVGRVVLPDDAKLSAVELAAAGYEFHEGRADFEPLSVPPGITPIRPPVVEVDAEAAQPEPTTASTEGTMPSSAAGADEDAQAGADASDAPATEPDPIPAPADTTAEPEPATEAGAVADPPAPSAADEAPAESASAAVDAASADEQAAPASQPAE